MDDDDLPKAMINRVKRVNSMTRKKKIIVFGVVCILIFIATRKCLQPVTFTFSHRSINSSCHLPDIDPFDSSILKYIWHPMPIECNPSHSVVFIGLDGKLRLNESVIEKYGKSKVDCIYRFVKRSGDDEVTFSSEVKYEKAVYIPSDAVNVKCNSGRTAVYDGVLYNVDFKTVLKNKKIEESNDESLNVLIFGLDSVSRLAAERKLTKTMRYIKHRLNGYVFKGYTSLSAITYPNVMAFLTGKSAFSKELPNINPRTEYTDDYPFIWKNFSDKGYVTMFGEDFPDIAIFNYMLKGFKDPPVDHYMRPYYIARQVVHPVQSNLDQVFMFLEDKNINVKKHSSLCYKEQPKHVIHMSNYQRFVSSYKDYRKFAFSWLTEIGHNYMNFLELADNDILNMLKSFHANGHLNNSVFVLLSDHGPRTDEMRNTPVGRVEERMPLLSIVVPEYIRLKYPNLNKNLRDNQDRLTSPYDLHETFVDILNANYEIKNDVTIQRPYPRGISLFRKIPKDRSCSDGAIAEHLCACYTARNVSIYTSLVFTVSNFVVQSINEKLKPHKQCSVLKLYTIKEAQEIETGLKAKVDNSRWTLLNMFYSPKYESEKRFLVLIETIPGHALFEATTSISSDNKLKLLGDVSRTNLYNNQSHCVSFKLLKPFCLCKDLT